MNTPALPPAESLTVEFKSDCKRFPDSELIEALVGLANTEGGDRVLLELDDEALDGALGFTTRDESGHRVPTLTGLLVIGRETALREKIPTHEFAFQVLERESVSFNEFRHFPLLKALDWLETNFRPYNPEREIQVGLFRVPVPKVDMGAFREAVANALVHRALADAMKRIGIVERSGRGVDKIYRGMLRFGRPEPDYSRTDHSSVILQLATVAADEVFLKLVVEQENQQKGMSLPIDTLIVLAALREHKRLGSEALSHHIHRDVTQTRRTLEQLVEAGLVQPHGSNRNRSYTLSADVYRAKGEQVAYTRQAGLSGLQHEQLVINHIQHHGRIQRREVMELCYLSKDQASKLLGRMKDEGKLIQHGQRRGTFYTLSGNEPL